MRNYIVIAITLGVFGGIILFLQDYVNKVYIHPRNPDNILFFEYGITVLTSHIVLQRNNNKAGFLKLFFTGFICTLTIFFLMMMKIWVMKGAVIFNFNNIAGPFMIAAGFNLVVALIVSNIHIKTKVNSNPEVLDDLDY